MCNLISSNSRKRNTVFLNQLETDGGFGRFYSRINCRLASRDVKATISLWVDLNGVDSAGVPEVAAMEQDTKYNPIMGNSALK